MVMALFVVATLVKLTLASGVFHTSPVGGPLIDSLAVGALMVGVSIWFIHCFTGDADRRIMDIFVFAYAFTIGAFAMLVLPFVGEQRQSASGAAPPSTMELVRGCVRRGSAGGLSEVSAVVLCPSGASADVPASAASWPAGQPTRYTLLLAVGGVTATVEEDQSVKLAAAAASAPPAAPAPEKPVAPAAEPPTHVEVVGGLALPFFVLVLSFIGGAVSLSRRIPEYQRRLHPQYTASPEESKMRPFEAREAVVFQIMQLVSAPFLSVATWYIVSPSGLASAATLAFGTGFASEPLLLMIRGMVKGIRPENAKFPQKADDPKPNPGLAPEALPPPAAPVDGAPGVPVAPPAAMPDPVEPPAPPELGPELGPISEHLLELPPAPGPITAPTGKT